MATLAEEHTWVDGIYRLEVSDRLLGGPDGVSNRQAVELASRTTWLKDQLDLLATAVASITSEGVVAPYWQYLTDTEIEEIFDGAQSTSEEHDSTDVIPNGDIDDIFLFAGLVD